MTLYRRGRKYSIQLWVDGVRHLKSTGTTNRREAERIEREFREELNRKRHQIRDASPDMTFAELAAKFLADGSPRPYHRDRLQVLLPYFGEFPIGRISKPALREYRVARRKEKPLLSETTLNRDAEALRRMMFWALDEGFLAENPLARLRLTKARRKPRPILSLDEEDKLLAAASPHLRQIITVALDTGMRRGELLTQRLEHVDLNRNLLQVTHSKTAGGEAREIPLTARAAGLFTHLKQDRPEGLAFTYKGKAIGKIKTAWKAAIRRACIRYMRFHDLRHSYNSRLMEAGVIQDIRKALMGHSDGQETNSLYTHIELPARREAIHKLELWRAAERQKLQKLENQKGERENDGQTETSERGNPDRGDSHRLPPSGEYSSDKAR